MHLPVLLRILFLYCFYKGRILCFVKKEGRGKNTSGVFGQVFVCTAGMLAVPIRLQYRVININNT